MTETTKREVLQRAAECGFFRNCCGRHNVDFSQLKAIAEAASDLLGVPVSHEDFWRPLAHRAEGRYHFLMEIITRERMAYNRGVLFGPDGLDGGRERLARERDAGRFKKSA
jgi:hypothetical protein